MSTGCERAEDGERDGRGGGDAHGGNCGDGDEEHAEEAEAERRARDEHLRVCMCV